MAEQYVGKVKCVYIDPPFNTAQTFANYEDNLEHSIWLTMMRDRLLHLRTLLSNDGSIWVHLDDVEVHRMRVLMDEVFGAGNFVAEVVWQKADSPRNDAAGFSKSHDVILVYSRTDVWSPNRVARLKSSNTSRYKSRDGDPVPWRDGDATAPGAATHQGMVYGIQHPVTGKMIYPTPGRHWGLSQEQMLANMRQYAPYELQDLGDDFERARICGVRPDEVRRGVLGIALATDLKSARSAAQARYEHGNWPEIVMLGLKEKFQRKKHLADDGRVPETLWKGVDVGGNLRAKNQLKQLFPEVSPFATPKPEELLERVIHIATNPGDVVLDVFAGSGTTAAVAQKMGRRWVTCELVEDTLVRFTRPRLEKVVRGEDPGGVTSVAGERVAADGVELPEGVSAEDAQAFTSVLNKVVKADPGGTLATDPAVKRLKALTKTVKTKPAVHWRGGGGFITATLAPPVFDYDPDLQLVTLTEHATGPTLVRSVAANLGFRLTPEHPHFHGVKNRMRLVVVEGTVTEATALDLAAHLAEGEGLTIAALGREEGMQEALRRAARGVRVLHVPDDLFRHGGTAAEEETA
nr:site-specific DNA-methyltransferase [Micrococcus flavus]